MPQNGSLPLESLTGIRPEEDPDVVLRDVTLERKERRGIEGGTAPIPGPLRVHPQLFIALATGDVSRGIKRSRHHRNRRRHEVSSTSESPYSPSRSFSDLNTEKAL